MFKISVGDTLEICLRYSSYSTLDPFHIMSCQLSMGVLSIQQAIIGGLLSTELMRMAKTCKQRLFDKAGHHIHIKKHWLRAANCETNQANRNLHTYLNMYIHVCMYVCMYIYIYILHN